MKIVPLAGFSHSDCSFVKVILPQGESSLVKFTSRFPCQVYHKVGVLLTSFSQGDYSFCHVSLIVPCKVDTGGCSPFQVERFLKVLVDLFPRGKFVKIAGIHLDIVNLPVVYRQVENYEYLLLVVIS
jgi:hypothetical protein